MAVALIRSCSRHCASINAYKSVFSTRKIGSLSAHLQSTSRNGVGVGICHTIKDNSRFSQATWSLTTHRNLWGWLNAIFNKVDESRIKDVGPDRACAEWLLRCGALVKWQNRESWTKDYNTLPVSGGRALKIAEIDATDAAIMHIGFPHFRGCKHIKRIVFHKAIYLEDAGMALLPLLQDSLKELQVSSCGNITIDGLRHIKKLKNLENLLLYDLPEIRDKDAVQKELEDALPNCAVVFPYAQPEDDPNAVVKKGKE